MITAPQPFVVEREIAGHFVVKDADTAHVTSLESGKRILKTRIQFFEETDYKYIFWFGNLRCKVDAFSEHLVDEMCGPFIGLLLGFLHKHEEMYPWMPLACIRFVKYMRDTIPEVLVKANPEIGNFQKALRKYSDHVDVITDYMQPFCPPNYETDAFFTRVEQELTKVFTKLLTVMVRDDRVKNISQAFQVLEIALQSGNLDPYKHVETPKVEADEEEEEEAMANGEMDEEAIEAEIEMREAEVRDREEARMREEAKIDRNVLGPRFSEMLPFNFYTAHSYLVELVSKVSQKTVVNRDAKTHRPEGIDGGFEPTAHELKTGEYEPDAHDLRRIMLAATLHASQMIFDHGHGYCMYCFHVPDPNARALLQCNRCRMVNYCDKKCKYEHRREHKSVCNFFTV